MSEEIMKDFYLPATNILQNQIYVSNTRFKHSPLYIDYIDDHRLSTYHTHNFTQIWYTISGTYEHTVNGNTITQVPGSVSLIYPYTPHQFSSLGCDLDTLRVISISLETESLHKVLPEFTPLSFSTAAFKNKLLPNYIQLSGESKRKADNLLAPLIDNILSGNSPTERQAFSDISSFFELCAQETDDEIHSLQKYTAAIEYAKCINNAVHFIAENYNRHIPAALTCREAMLSQRQFDKVFKAVTGQTYHNFLLAKRMTDAINDLLWSNNTLYQISSERGFAHSSHLINTCIRHLGKSPTKFREENSARLENFGHIIKQRKNKLDTLSKWNLTAPVE